MWKFNIERSSRRSSRRSNDFDAAQVNQPLRLARPNKKKFKGGNISKSSWLDPWLVLARHRRLLGISGTERFLRQGSLPRALPTPASLLLIKQRICGSIRPPPLRFFFRSPMSSSFHAAVGYIVDGFRKSPVWMAFP